MVLLLPLLPPLALLLHSQQSLVPIMRLFFILLLLLPLMLR
jgi:hypothetical protein